MKTLNTILLSLLLVCLSQGCSGGGSKGGDSAQAPAPVGPGSGSDDGGKHVVDPPAEVHSLCTELLSTGVLVPSIQVKASVRIVLSEDTDERLIVVCPGRLAP